MVAIFGHNKRPQVDSQNTGRDAYERPYGVGTVSPQGMGGANNFSSLSPFNPTGFNLAFITQASITGTGNDTNANPIAMPLNDKPQGRQF